MPFVSRRTSCTLKLGVGVHAASEGRVERSNPSSTCSQQALDQRCIRRSMEGLTFEHWLAAPTEFATAVAHCTSRYHRTITHPWRSLSTCTSAFYDEDVMAVLMHPHHGDYPQRLPALLEEQSRSMVLGLQPPNARHIHRQPNGPGKTKRP